MVALQHQRPASVAENKPKLGDIVLYNFKRGDDCELAPAIVTGVKETEDAEPVLALVVFVTGFHLGCTPVPSARYGDKPSHWKYRGEETESSKKAESKPTKK